MNINFLSCNYWPFHLLFFISSIIILPGCNDEEGFPHAGDAAIQGELKFIDAVTGNSKYVPVGADIEVFFEDSELPDFTFKTTEKGKYIFTPQAIGDYKLRFSHTDSTLQYSSSLVKPEDIDTLRISEFQKIEYRDTIDVKVSESNKIVESVTLDTKITGLRVIAKDSLGNRLNNIQICLYNNEKFYKDNFPNCGGSLKYITTNADGIAFFSGLEPIKYFINARGNVGKVTLNNHYSPEAQVVRIPISNSIEELEFILK